MNEKLRGGCVIRSALLAIWKFIKGNKLSTSLILTAAVGITVAAVSVRQPALTVLPLYISLFVGMLSAGANRYANVIGAANGLCESPGCGRPRYRHIKVHICPRVHVLSTPKDPSP